MPTVYHSDSIPLRTDAIPKAAATSRQWRDFVLYDGRPARILSKNGELIIEAHTVPSVRAFVMRNCHYVGEDGKVKTPPESLMQDILQVGTYPPDIPDVSGITRSPVVLKDGRIIQEEGYNAESRLVLDLSRLPKGLSIPPTPSSGDVAFAVSVLKDMLHDFPVADEASLANYIGMLLTTLTREMIGAPVPAFLMRANAAGTGKTLFANIVGVIATGDPVPSVPFEKSSEMMERLLVARIRSNTAGIIHFDNVSSGVTIRQDSLASFITSGVVGSRILRSSEQITVRNRSMVIINGNSPSIGGDMRRRMVLIDLDAGCSRPEERIGFKHVDLLGYVRENRGAILSALLTLVQHYVRAGMPRPRLNPTGGFERFDLVIGGILECAGIPGFRGNRDILNESMDVDEEELCGFLREWMRTIGSDWKTCGEILELIDEESLPDRVLASKYAMRGRTLGYLLREIKGRRFGNDGVHVEVSQASGNRKKWKVVSAQPTNN